MFPSSGFRKACDRIRTSDLLITNELHYQLCYTSIYEYAMTPSKLCPVHHNKYIIPHHNKFVKPFLKKILLFLHVRAAAFFRPKSKRTALLSGQSVLTYSCSLPHL